MIYEYECPGDGEVIQIERLMSAAEGEYFCNICGAKLRRIYNAPPISFKGKGFYKNGG